MNKKIKIVIISHAQIIPESQNRWKKLSMDSKYEVHLIIPKQWIQTWFGEKKVFRSQDVHKQNFYIHSLATTNKYNWVKYFFKSVDIKFRSIKPDLIYIIQSESSWVHHQIYLYKKLFAPKAKIIFFSMNARGVPYKNEKKIIKRYIKKVMWKNIKRNTNAAIVHYPGCLKSLQDACYSKPVFIQTQIGVNENLFKFDNKIRKKYRKKINFENKFVIGYAGRLIIDKGVDDLIAVFIKLANKNKKIALLLVGNGNIKKKIEQKVRDNNLNDRVHITGFVDQGEVFAYMNAMDCFVLGSKTMPNWTDTFPLVTVQAQAIGLPVLASDSGSLPWQLNHTALFFKEGNRNDMKNKLLQYINSSKIRMKYSDMGHKRTLFYFCNNRMTENFKKIINQIIKEKIIYHKKNESYKQWKAY